MNDNIDMEEYQKGIWEALFEPIPDDADEATGLRLLFDGLQFALMSVVDAMVHISPTKSRQEAFEFVVDGMRKHAIFADVN